jgi:uncharacterized protein (UPF0261 family)
MSTAYIIGTCDTKGRELRYVKAVIETLGVTTALVDIGIRSTGKEADFGPREVARCHPEGAERVFVNDRGAAVRAMTEALRLFLRAQPNVGGVFGLGGSGGTAMITAAMRDLPIGVPKLMVSTIASGNVAPFVDCSDIGMFPTLTDIAGLNRITRLVLANAAHAFAGMMKNAVDTDPAEKPAVGLTMFGVTTPCVTQVADSLSDRYDPLIFHATGAPWRSSLIPV